MTLDLYLVSERETGGSWEDCVWSTGVMAANVMVGENRYPATRSEYEGLRFSATGVREASGDGSNYRELEDGMAKRYNLIVRRGSGWAAALAEAPVGSWLAMQGLYKALPSTLRITGFTGGHSFLFRRTDADSVSLFDPLAVNGSKPRSASLAAMRAYYDALPGAEWIALYEREAWRQPMIVFNLERWRIPAGTPVFENPNGVQVTKFNDAVQVTTIGIPNDHSTDGVNFGWRALLVTTGALDGKLRMKIAFIRRPTGDAIVTDPAWDAATLQALLNPAFRGGDVVHAEATEIANARKAGILAGIGLVDADVEKLRLANGG